MGRTIITRGNKLLRGDEGMTSHTGKTSTVVDAFLNAVNAHDVNRLGDTLSDDVLYWEANLTAPINGREAVKNHFRENWKSFPDSHITVVRRIESGDWIADETEWSGTHKGPIGVPGQSPILPTGKRVQGKAVGIGQVHEGKIRRLNIYYDNMGYMAQLGLIPGPK